MGTEANENGLSSADMLLEGESCSLARGVVAESLKMEDGKGETGKGRLVLALTAVEQDIAGVVVGAYWKVPTKDLYETSRTSRMPALLRSGSCLFLCVLCVYYNNEPVLK
jgi:hypothetical protein